MIRSFLYKYFFRLKKFIFRMKKKRAGVLISSRATGYMNASFEGQNRIPDRCNFSGRISLGYRTTLGYNNFFHGDISIGKYCQIGADVAIHTTNHPISFLSSYISSSLFNGELSKLKEYKKTIIGNDVWIGHNALIIGGVSIGDGAVIAAGAVVTKDIPPYAVVAGVPAKIIRYRYNFSVIKEIQELKWWDLNDFDLEEIKHLFFKDFSDTDTIY